MSHAYPLIEVVEELRKGIDLYFVSCEDPSEQHSDNNDHFIDSVILLSLQKVIEIVDSLGETLYPLPSRNGKPSPPPTLLSLNHLRVVYSSLEILWRWRISPFLCSESGFQLTDDIHPKSLIISNEQLHTNYRPKSVVDGQRVLAAISCFFRVISNRVFAGTMLQRNLRRLLFGILVLKEADSTSTAVAAISLLDEVLVSRMIDAANIIRDLRFASKGPARLRDSASSLFTKIILSDGGLHAVLQAYTVDVGDSSNIGLLVKVAKLTTSTPKSMDQVEYLRNIADQVVALFTASLRVNDKTIAIVCTMIISRFAYLCPRICEQRVLLPLSRPLLTDIIAPANKSRNLSNSSRSRRSTQQPIDNNDDKNADDNDADVLEISVNELTSLCTICPLQPPLLKCIHQAGLGRRFISLHMFLLAECRSSSVLPFVEQLTDQYVKQSTDHDEVAAEFYSSISTSSSFQITRNKNNNSNNQQNKQNSNQQNQNQEKNQNNKKSNPHQQQQQQQCRVTVAAAHQKKSSRSALELIDMLGLTAAINSSIGAGLSPSAAGASGSSGVLDGFDLSTILNSIKQQQQQQQQVDISMSDSSSSNTRNDPGTSTDTDTATATSTTTNPPELESLLMMAALSAIAAEEVSHSIAQTSSRTRTRIQEYGGAGSSSGPAHNDVPDEEEEEEEEEDLAGTISLAGHAVLEIALRARAAAEVLVTLGGKKATTTNSRPDNDNDGDDEKSGEGGTNSCSSNSSNKPPAASAAARVASALFLQAVKSYLIEDIVDTQNNRDQRGGGGGASSAAAAQRSCAGVVVMTLQAHIPLGDLLCDGIKILTLMKSFLQSYSEYLHQNMPTSAAAVVTIPTVPVDTNNRGQNNNKGPGPLIQEIQQQKAVRANKEDDDDVDDDDDDDGDSRKEMMSCVVAIVTGMLTLGSEKRTVEERGVLREFLPLLNSIAQYERDAVVAQSASDAALLLLLQVSDGSPSSSSGLSAIQAAQEKQKQRGGGSKPSSIQDVFQGQSDNLESSSPAIRAFGLHNVCHSVRNLKSSIVEADISYAVEQLLQLIKDPDSYVYLAVLQVIAAVADISRMRVMSMLLSAFADGTPKAANNNSSSSSSFLIQEVVVGQGANTAANSSSNNGSHDSSATTASATASAAAAVLSLRDRSLVGEAVSMVLRRAGDAAPPFTSPVIAACLRLLRTTKITGDDAKLLNEVTDLRTMRITTTAAPATADAAPVNAVDVDSSSGATATAAVGVGSSHNSNRSNNSGTVDQQQKKKKKGGGGEAEEEGADADVASDMNILAYNAAISTAASTADAVLLRQSAISLLADAVVMAGYSADRHMLDVLDVANGVLTFERGLSQSSSNSRRSAAFLMRYILSGLRDKIFTLRDAGNHLKTLYRTLKTAVRDADQVVRFHSESGLAVLDELMREQLFFSEAQLRGENMPKLRITK